jgi:hypothetical protein
MIRTQLEMGFDDTKYQYHIPYTTRNVEVTPNPNEAFYLMHVLCDSFNFSKSPTEI